MPYIKRIKPIAIKAYVISKKLTGTIGSVVDKKENSSAKDISQIPVILNSNPFFRLDFNEVFNICNII